MSEKVMNRSRLILVSLLGVFAIAALTIWGCGTSGYENPSTDAVTTKTATALIQASDLKQWSEAGLVNKTGGYDRVVVLDVTSNPAATSADNMTNTYYTVGHIPGAQLIAGANAANSFQETRPEGPLDATGSMVFGGAAMDSLIQNYGIDGNTTIVLTTGGTAPLNLTRHMPPSATGDSPKTASRSCRGATRRGLPQVSL
ncbi:hypothetical protein [Geotalea toluenoxydans]|uniref:hypothetical protein n=1 Tax=Geotalea toluenoxydans TaxID=421624 RepID=UPI000A450EF8|nr:hypothetical protein [Geotalea toluenoxydans]